MGTPCAPKRKRERCSGPACTQCKTRPERTCRIYPRGFSSASGAGKRPAHPDAANTAHRAVSAENSVSDSAARCLGGSTAKRSLRALCLRSSSARIRPCCHGTNEPAEPRRQQSLLANGCSSFLRGDSQRGRRLRAAGLGAPSQPASSAAPPAAWVAPLRDHAILSAAPPAAWVAPLRNPQNSAAPPAAWVARARGKPL